MDYNKLFIHKHVEEFKEPNDLNSIAKMCKFCLTHKNESIKKVKVVVRETENRFEGFYLAIEKREIWNSDRVDKLVYGNDFSTPKEEFIEVWNKDYEVASFYKAMETINTLHSDCPAISESY